MLCIACYLGPGLVPRTSRWQVTNCADEPTLVGTAYNVLEGEEPRGVGVGVFEFEPADQFLRSGRPLEALIRSPLALVPLEEQLTRADGAIWTTVSICGVPHQVELLEVVEKGGHQAGTGRFTGRFEALWDFAGAVGRLATIQFGGKAWALNIVPRLV